MGTSLVLQYNVPAGAGPVLLQVNPSETADVFGNVLPRSFRLRSPTLGDGRISVRTQKSSDDLSEACGVSNVNFVQIGDEVLLQVSGASTSGFVLVIQAQHSIELNPVGQAQPFPAGPPAQCSTGGGGGSGQPMQVLYGITDLSTPAPNGGPPPPISDFMGLYLQSVSGGKGSVITVWNTWVVTKAGIINLLTGALLTNLGVVGPGIQQTYVNPFVVGSVLLQIFKNGVSVGAPMTINAINALDCVQVTQAIPVVPCDRISIFFTFSEPAGTTVTSDLLAILNIV